MNTLIDVLAGIGAACIASTVALLIVAFVYEAPKRRPGYVPTSRRPPGGWNAERRLLERRGADPDTPSVSELWKRNTDLGREIDPRNVVPFRRKELGLDDEPRA